MIIFPVKSVCIVHTTFTNVASLSRVTNLTIKYRKGVTDVASLSSVTNLIINECHNITDVSVLSLVTYLNLGCLY